MSKENIFNINEKDYIFLSLIPDKRDIRDHIYSSPFKLEDLPPKMDFSSFMNPVKNQKSSSMCTGFAVSAMKEWQENREHEEEVEAGKYDHRPNKFYDLSEQWIYYKAREIDGLGPTVAGSTIKSAMQVLYKVGVPTESGWPFHESIKSHPENWTSLIARWSKIGSYARIYGNDQLKASLYSNGPLVVGIGFFKEIFKVGDDGIVKEPANPRLCLGGHAILIIGYDDDTQMFKFKNSWGSEWGQGGYGYISYNYILRYMWDAWAALDISVTKAMMKG